MLLFLSCESFSLLICASAFISSLTLMFLPPSPFPLFSLSFASIPSPFPLLLSFPLHSLHSSLSGAAPVYVSVGPYTYRQFKDKIDVQFLEDGKRYTAFFLLLCLLLLLFAHFLYLFHPCAPLNPVSVFSSFSLPSLSSFLPSSLLLLLSPSLLTSPLPFPLVSLSQVTK